MARAVWAKVDSAEVGAPLSVAVKPHPVSVYSQRQEAVTLGGAH